MPAKPRNPLIKPLSTNLVNGNSESKDSPLNTQAIASDISLTLPKVHVPSEAEIVHEIQELSLRPITTLTPRMRRDLGTKLSTFGFLSPYEIALPNTLVAGHSIKNLALHISPVLQDSLNTPQEKKRQEGFDWPLCNIHLTGGSSQTTIRALPLGRIALTDSGIRHHTYWVVVLAEVAGWEGTNIFAVRAHGIAEAEEIPEEDFELMDEDEDVSESGRCKYSPWEDLFGPRSSGLVYCLGPPQLLGPILPDTVKAINGVQDLNGAQDAVEKFHKPQPLNVSSWTSEPATPDQMSISPISCKSRLVSSQIAYTKHEMNEPENPSAPFTTLPLHDFLGTT